MALRAILMLALALLLASPGAEAAAPAAPGAKDPVVARVNGFEIHRSDIEDAARSLPPQLRQQPVNQIYSMILSQMVGTTLAAQAARREKLQDRPEVKRRMMLIRDQVLAQLYMDEVIRKNITEAKLKAAYDRYLKTAPPREEVKARHILLPTEAEAKAVIEQLKKGADFATLAKEKTTDPDSKASGGDLGWFGKDQMVPAIANAAFKLKKGEFSQTPIKTQFGWHVIKIEDRRVAKPPSFDQIKQQMANDLIKKLVAEKMQDLKKTAKIEVFNSDGSKPGTPPRETAPPPAARAPQAINPGPNLLGGAPAPEPQSGIPVLSPATKQ